MSNTPDETMKIPQGSDPAAEARARIAALTDSHLVNDHPLMKSEEPKPEPKPVTADLGNTKPLHSPAATPKTMPAEWVSNKKKLRPLPSKARPIVSAIASFLLLLLIFKSEVVLSQIKYLTTKAEPAAQTQTEPAKADKAQVSAAPVISIPKIKVSAPIVYEPSISEPAVQKALQKGVVHYGNTPEPGQPGNAVIVGHSSNDWWEPGKYKFVFVLLDKLIVGDKFTVNHKGKRYVYEVTESKVVAPTDLSVLAQTPEPTITLITCTPPGTSWKRLVVHAKQISPSPQTVHSGTPKDLEGTIAKLPSNAPDFFDQIWQFIKGMLDRLNKALS